MRSVASVCAYVSVCLCVCPVCALTFESFDVQNCFWYAGTSSEYLGQVLKSRSSGQSQGHRSKLDIRA